MLQNIMAASKPMLINEEKNFIESEIDLISLDLQEIIELKNSSTKAFDNETSFLIVNKTNSEKPKDELKKVKQRKSSPIRIRGRGRTNNKPKSTTIFRLKHKNKYSKLTSHSAYVATSTESYGVKINGFFYPNFM